MLKFVIMDKNTVMKLLEKAGYNWSFLMAFDDMFYNHTGSSVTFSFSYVKSISL